MRPPVFVLHSVGQWLVDSGHRRCVVVVCLSRVHSVVIVLAQAVDNKG